MSAKTYIVDSGGTTRFCKKIWIIDSGNVARRAKKIWIIDSGNVARLIFTGADYLSMLAGFAGSTVGYAVGGFGILTPTTLGDGSTVQELASSSTFPHPMVFTIDGYAGTITSSYLTNVTVNTTVFLASAATFSGGGLGGSANWSWSTGFNFINGTSYTVAVQRS